MNVAERAPKEKREMDRERERRASKRRFHGGWSRPWWFPFMRASLAVEILRHETHTRGAGGATVSGPSGIIDVSHREQRAACSSL